MKTAENEVKIARLNKQTNKNSSHSQRTVAARNKLVTIRCQYAAQTTE